MKKTVSLVTPLNSVPLLHFHRVICPEATCVKGGNIQIVYKGITCYNAITRVITQEEGMKKLEVRELLEVDELSEVTDHGKVIAHVVPVSEPKQPVERDTSEAWKNLKRLSTELSAHWPKDVTA